MPAAQSTDQEFMQAFHELQSTKAVSEKLGVAREAVQRRRRHLERKYGVLLPVADNRPAYNTAVTIPHQKAKIEFSLKDGQMVVFSDAHYFPNEITTAHRGLVAVIQELKPAAVVCNGDAFDGATISRHPRIGWDNKPKVKDELQAVQDRLGEIEAVSGSARLFWPLGNHCARFETRLAAQAPEYEGVAGFTLKDHFPRWIPCWAVMVNGNTMIKHRYHNGVHAAYNNALKAGTSIVTGHLHSLKVTPWTDYNGDRYGVDTGTLAEVYGDQFESYMECNPRNWRSGFAVLTYVEGKLMPPELAQVVGEGKLFFRGEIWNV